LPRYDFRCAKCGTVFETSMSFEQLRRELPCRCGGVAVLAWLKAPGLAGVSEPSTRGITRTFTPGYDIQLGKTFADRAERDRYLKSRGLEAVGPDEWHRNQSSMPSRQDSEPEFRDLGDVMKESWEETKSAEARGDPAPVLPVVDLKDGTVIIPEGEN
jgi:hypothetical protein